MNPTQKAGNVRRKKRNQRYRKGDYHIKRIARVEAQKTLAKKIESKTYDQSFTAISADFNGSFFSLTTNLVRGTGENDYIGDSIRPSHLRIKWACIGTDNSNLLRVIVLQNKAGGVPVGGTLFQLSGSVNTPLSPYNTSYNTTFRILFDEFYSMVNTPSNLPTDSSQLTGDIRIPAKKLRPINFSSVGTASAGDIYLVFVSDSSVVTPPIAQFYSRLYFKDA